MKGTRIDLLMLSGLIAGLILIPLSSAWPVTAGAPASTHDATASPVQWMDDGHSASDTTDTPSPGFLPQLQCPDQYEPNPDFGEAWTLKPGRIQSYICDQNDVDYFRFSVKFDELIRVHLHDLPANYDLCLFGPDRKLVACSANDDTNEEFVQQLASSAGDYYALIYGVKGAYSNLKSYTLELSLDTTTPQIKALWRLLETSLVKADVRFEHGVPHFISVRIPLPQPVPDDPMDKALAFLEDYKDLFLLTDPDRQFRLERRTGIGEEKHLFFLQVHEDIPVFSAMLAVHIDGDDVTGTSGAYVPDIAVSSEPMISAKTAEKKALQDSGFQIACVTGETALMYFDRSLVADAEPETHLAWRVSLGCGTAATYFVDAHSGQVVWKRTRQDEAFDLAVFTANNNTSGSCWTGSDAGLATQWYDEAGVLAGTTPDADGTDAFNFAGDTYDYFWNTHGRDSYDGAGREIRIYVHRDVNWQNAWWVPDCDFFEFGDGWAGASVTNDTVAHEFTHALVQHTADLVSGNQSGALEESYGDVFGAMVDRSDWRQGEDHFARAALRDLCDPDSIWTGLDPVATRPDHMDEYYVSAGCPDHPDVANDFCWVHFNAGIPNRAACLLSEGGTHDDTPDITVAGIGRSKLERIYYETLTNRLGSGADFAEAREQTIAAAESLVDEWFWDSDAGRGRWFVESDVCAVKNAFAAVGIGRSDLDCDGTYDDADWDIDGDRIANSDDNCPYTPNPFQGDADGDGQGNDCDDNDDNDSFLDEDDNCPRVANDCQYDRDGDGIGEACDDDDHDGIRNDGDASCDVSDAPCGDRERVGCDDNCRLHSNWSQSNYDGDNLGDACDPDDDNDWVYEDGDFSGAEGDAPCTGGATTSCDDNCPFLENTDQRDDDGDGVGDDCDNCPGLYNPGPGQADPDEDGLGFSCDDDNDGDGILNGDDNCPITPNPDQGDLDRNGIGTACDPGERFKFFGDAELAILEGFMRFRDTLPALKIPIWPCLSCDTTLPEYYATRVSLQLGVGVAARIVDDEGMVVTSDYSGALNKALTFFPKPSYRPPALNLGDQLAHVAQQQDSLGQTPRYVLELLASPNVAANKDYPIRIQVQSRPPTCYDFDWDGQVDIDDVHDIASRWRSSTRNPDPDKNPLTPNYRPEYDVVQDTIIDVHDIAVVVSHWNEQCP